MNKLLTTIACFSLTTVIFAQQPIWNNSSVSTTTNGSVRIAGHLGVGASINASNRFNLRSGSNTPSGIYVQGNYTGGNDTYGIRISMNQTNNTRFGIHSTLIGQGSNSGFAIFGESLGANTYAGYFRGRGYFQREVGIGIANPLQPLHVKGATLIDGPGAALRLGKDDITPHGEVGVSYSNNSDPDSHVPGFNIHTPYGSSAGLQNFLMFVNTEGNVGIGVKPSKINPNFKLSVNGSIRAKEIVVETGWADFVFDADYELRSLQEVEAFINKNGHLPEVPSATEVQENGAAVGSTQTLLLQKIEELTLYMIEQQKQIDALKEKLNAVTN